jgi:hypothetical protein
MVVAVVHDHTFRIDPYVANTVDYAKVGEHYYSDKAPGAAFLGIPVYAILNGVMEQSAMSGLVARLSNNEAIGRTLRESGTGLLEDKVRLAIAQVALTVVASALPTALMSALLYVLLRRFVDSPWPRVLVAVGYGLLTPAFAYAGQFYGHQLSAACLFVAFYLVFMARKAVSTARLLGVGLLLGYSVITEYPSALIAGVLFVYTFCILDDKRRIAWVILTGMAVAAGWMAYNQAVFGSPLALGYSHSELWQEQHQTGFMSLSLPRWEALWGITFSGYRGLFVLSPLLLLSVPGFVLWYRSGENRAEFWTMLFSIVATFLFNSSSVMWWGGYAVGPRYLLPMLPFMALPMVLVFRAWGRQPWLRILTAVLALWSLVATWGLALADQAFPPDTIHNPLRDYAWPSWQQGNIARNLGMFLHLSGVPSLLPLVLGSGVLWVVLWVAASNRMGRKRLR